MFRSPCRSCGVRGRGGPGDRRRQCAMSSRAATAGRAASSDGRGGGGGGGGGINPLARVRGLFRGAQRRFSGSGTEPSGGRGGGGSGGAAAVAAPPGGPIVGTPAGGGAPGPFIVETSVGALSGFLDALHDFHGAVGCARAPMSVLLRVRPTPPVGHMRIRMRARWTYAYPHARPLDICVSACAPVGHMRIPRRPLDTCVARCARGAVCISRVGAAGRPRIRRARVGTRRRGCTGAPPRPARARPCTRRSLAPLLAPAAAAAAVA